MKKEYIAPSMKVMEMNVESVILAGSGEELIVNPTSTTSGDGVQFNDFETSNTDGTSNWEL